MTYRTAHVFTPALDSLGLHAELGAFTDWTTIAAGPAGAAGADSRAAILSAASL